MANFVTKKDGTRVAFDPEKIKGVVMASGLEAGLSEEENNEIAEKVLEAVTTALKEQEEVSSKEIRSIILSELEVIAPIVCESWKKYEEGKGV